MGHTILRVPCPKVTVVTNTRQERVVCLCCAAQGWKLLLLELLCDILMFHHPQDSARKSENALPGTVTKTQVSEEFSKMIHFTK